MRVGFQWLEGWRLVAECQVEAGRGTVPGMAGGPLAELSEKRSRVCRAVEALRGGQGRNHYGVVERSRI